MHKKQSLSCVVKLSQKGGDTKKKQCKKRGQKARVWGGET